MKLHHKFYITSTPLLASWFFK